MVTGVVVALVAVPVVGLVVSREPDRAMPAATPGPTLTRIDPNPNVLYPVAEREGRHEVIHVVFPDGMAARVSYPAELGLAGMGVRPYQGAWLELSAGAAEGGKPGQGEPGPGESEQGERADGQSERAAGGEDSGGAGQADWVALPPRFRELTAPPGGEAAVGAGGPMIRKLADNVTLWPKQPGSTMYGQTLLFAFDPWRIALRDRRQGMTFEERTAWAANLRGTVTPAGFLVLSAEAPVRLARPGEVVRKRPVGPQLLFGGGMGDVVALVPTPHCAVAGGLPATVDGRGRTAKGVCRDGVYIAASGGKEQVERVLKGVRVKLSPGGGG
jgi:hypothetical protein